MSEELMQAVNAVRAAGEMEYAQVIGMFRHAPNNAVMSRLREMLAFRLEVDEDGTVRHIVSVKDGEQ